MVSGGEVDLTRISSIVLDDCGGKIGRITLRNRRRTFIEMEKKMTLKQIELSVKELDIDEAIENCIVIKRSMVIKSIQLLKGTRKKLKQEEQLNRTVPCVAMRMRHIKRVME